MKTLKGLECRDLVTSRAYKATWGFLSLTFFLIELTAYFALKKKKALAEREKRKQSQQLRREKSVCHLVLETLQAKSSDCPQISEMPARCPGSSPPRPQVSDPATPVHSAAAPCSLTACPPDGSGRRSGGWTPSRSPAEAGWSLCLGQKRTVTGAGPADS